MYYELILTKFASSPVSYEQTSVPTLSSVKDDVSPLISPIILPQILTLSYSVRLQTSYVLYGNVYVVSKIT